jgi:hypothetical protein
VIEMDIEGSEQRIYITFTKYIRKPDGKPTSRSVMRGITVYLRKDEDPNLLREKIINSIKNG